MKPIAPRNLRPFRTTLSLMACGAAVSALLLAASRQRTPQRLSGSGTPKGVPRKSRSPYAAIDCAGVLLGCDRPSTKTGASYETNAIQILP